MYYVGIFFPQTASADGVLNSCKGCLGSMLV